jgi:hypothetical protein
MFGRGIPDLASMPPMVLIAPLLVVSITLTSAGLDTFRRHSRGDQTSGAADASDE